MDGDRVADASVASVDDQFPVAVLDRDHDGDVDFSDLAGAAMIAASAVSAARRL